MKVYIGWSGERSKQVGEIFFDMLPYIIQSSEPFFSPEIGKGLQWLSEITDELRVSAIGIICLTRENLNEPWILYEAGALSKGLLENHVCTYLLDLESSEVSEPLSQFQDTKNTKIDLLRLMKTINSCAERPLSENILSDSFERWWPDFEIKINSIPSYKEVTGEDLPPPREERELLKDILGILREDKRERGGYTPQIAFGPLVRRVKAMLLIKVEPEMRDEIKRQLMMNLALQIAIISTPEDKKDEMIVKFYEELTTEKTTTISLIKGIKSIHLMVI